MPHTLESPVHPDRELEDFERELKFTVPDVCVPAVLQWLGAVCDPDPAFPHGIVSSIYYDTRDGRYLGEKLNSDYLKTKIRLRWYRDPENPSADAPAFLEAKYRIGARREKMHLAMPFHGSWVASLPLTDSRLLALPRLVREEGYPLEASVVPLFTIQYERHRFIDRQSGLRVSLDTDIRVPAVNPLVVRPGRAVRLPIAVTEIKGDFTDVPASLLGLMALGARKTSFSKLSACYQAMMRASF